MVKSNERRTGTIDDRKLVTKYQPVQIRRSRWLSVVVAILLIPLGLAARRFRAQLPSVIGECAPDTLWATMVYFIFALIAPRRPIWQIVLATVIFSFAIEFSQLYYAPWIDAIRATSFGALILGRTFLVWQLACYSAGVAIGAGLDWIISSARPCSANRATTPA